MSRIRTAMVLLIGLVSILLIGTFVLVPERPSEPSSLAVETRRRHEIIPEDRSGGALGRNNVSVSSQPLPSPKPEGSGNEKTYNIIGPMLQSRSVPLSGDEAIVQAEHLKDVTAQLAQRLLRDCLLREKCIEARKLAKDAFGNGLDLVDAWSTQHENEIREYLVSVSPENNFNAVGVRCGNQSCFVLVASQDSNTIFGVGHLDGIWVFEKAFNNQPWADDFVSSADPSSGGIPVVTSWRVINLDAKPWIVSYVLRRKP